MATLRWKEIPCKKVTPEEYNQTIDMIHEEGLVEVGWSHARRFPYYAGTFMFHKSPYKYELRWFDDHGPQRIITGDYISTEQEDGITGLEAYNAFQRVWQKNSKTTLYRAFSGPKYHEEYRAIKNCVPRQIGYCTYQRERILHHCYKADVSSAFPFQASKSLPTLHDHKKVSGYAAPTEEYPFVFYIKSGHMAIYNELDTRKWEGNQYYTMQWEQNNYAKVPDCNEISIMCKASEYSLADTMKFFYDHRNSHKENKMIMNATIGFFHRNGDPQLSHLAAVIIARSNQRMLTACNNLLDNGSNVLYIATDSIVWNGNYSDIAVDEKGFGNFTYEGKDIEFYGLQVGAYQTRDKEGKVVTKCSYIDNGDEKDNIAFGFLPRPKTTKFVLDPKTHKIIVLI